jgi:hypothetical protein
MANKAKAVPTINEGRSVTVGNRIFVPGEEDELAQALTEANARPEDIIRLTEEGAVSYFGLLRRDAVDPTEPTLQAGVMDPTAAGHSNVQRRVTPNSVDHDAVRDAIRDGEEGGTEPAKVKQGFTQPPSAEPGKRGRGRPRKDAAKE